MKCGSVKNCNTFLETLLWIRKNQMEPAPDVAGSTCLFLNPNPLKPKIKTNIIHEESIEMCFKVI